jgi:hypothetical protein
MAMTKAKWVTSERDKGLTNKQTNQPKWTSKAVTSARAVLSPNKGGLPGTLLEYLLPRTPRGETRYPPGIPRESPKWTHARGW